MTIHLNEKFFFTGSIYFKYLKIEMEYYYYSRNIYIRCIKCNILFKNL